MYALFGLTLRVALAQDTGDGATDCPAKTEVVDAVYDGDCCVTCDTTEVCSVWDDVCPTWEEMSASYRGDPDWELVDCVEGGPVAHEATNRQTSFMTTYTFDGEGTLIGRHLNPFDEAPWCCEGHGASCYTQGIVEECIPAEPDDTGGDDDDKPPSGCAGCASMPTGPSLSLSLLAALAITFRRRPSGA